MRMCLAGVVAAGSGEYLLLSNLVIWVYLFDTNLEFNILRSRRANRGAVSILRY